MYLNANLYDIETQEELEESLKALVSQNNDLVDLLQKANIKVPNFVGPKCLSFIITVHDVKPTAKIDEIKKIDNKITNPNASAQNNNLIQKLQEKSKVGTVELIENPLSSNNKEINHKKTISDIEHSESKSLSKSQLKILPELKEFQSFGSVDLIPVNNLSKPELKVHGKPVKNSVEITPLVTNQNEKVAGKQPEKSYDSIQLKEPSNLQGWRYNYH